MNEPIKKQNPQIPESYKPETPTLLNKLEGISIDKIVETYDIGGATIELIDRPEIIFAGAIGFASKIGEEPDIDYIAQRMHHYDENHAQFQNPITRMIENKTEPVFDICISIDYWRGKTARWGMMFAHEVSTKKQPWGVDIFTLPAGLYLRVLNDA